MSKIYYEKPYDPNASDPPPPDCFSDNGIGASSQALKPQSKLCNACPHNVWGSDNSRLTGKPTKACNDVQKVAILVPGHGEMIFLLRVPPASLKHLGKYAREIGSFSAGGQKVDITDLVTQLSFDKDAVGILHFAPLSFVDEAMSETQKKIWEAKGSDQIVGKLDKPYTGEAVATIAPPAAQPAEARSLPPPPPSGTATAAPFTLPNANIPAAPQEEPKKPRGRPKKESSAEPATQAPFMTILDPTKPTPPISPAASEDLDIPAFLKRGAPAEQAPPKPQPAAFGMEANAPAPDAEMQRRIEEALRLPT